VQVIAWKHSSPNDALCVEWEVKHCPLTLLCCSGGAGARGTRGQMSGRGAARGGGPAGRGRGAPATGSMLPPAAPSYGTEGYDYVRYIIRNLSHIVLFLLS